MLSKAAFTNLLEHLVEHDRIQIPDVLLPQVMHYWEARETENALQTLQLDIDPQVLPLPLQDAVRYYSHDGATDLVQAYPGVALAVVLTEIWVGQVRNSRLLRFAEAKSRAELRPWVACLIPIARYLQPAFDPATSKRDYPAILHYIGDATWVEQWVGRGELARNMAELAKDLPQSTYQRWRAEGVVQLWDGVKTILTGRPLTAADVVTALPAISAPVTLLSTASPGVLEMPRLPAARPILQPFLPPLPRLCIERVEHPELVAALAGGVPRGTVLYGGAGLGKTTLAGQVVRAPEVQAAFPGGLAWASGAQPVEKIAETWCSALGLKRSGQQESWEHCWRRQGASCGRVLLVLDDVVNLRDLAVLQEGFGPQAGLLITTQFGAETWEELAHTWLAPGEIQRVAVGPFTPAEGRALVEQGQGGALEAEAWAVVEQLGIQSGWDPTFISRVAVQRGVAEWQVLRRELLASGFAADTAQQRQAIQWEQLAGKPEREWLELLVTAMDAPTLLSLPYAAAVWRVEAVVARERLERLEQLGLVESVLGGDPVGLLPDLWRIRPRAWLCVPRAGLTVLQRAWRRYQALRLASRIRKLMGKAWQIPWQYRLLTPFWLGPTMIWEFVGWVLSSLRVTVPRWLISHAQRKHELARRGTLLPVEYQVLLQAQTLFIGNVGLVLGVLLGISLGLYWLLGHSGLPPLLRDLVLWWFDAGQVLIIIYIVVSFYQHAPWMPWLLTRIGVDYPPLRWLARAARWLGMREPDAA